MNFYGPRTQRLIEETVVNDVQIAYEVPVGKKFWLVEAMLVTVATGAGRAYVAIHNAAHVHIRHLCSVNVRENNKGVVLADHFEPGYPIEMAATEHLMVTSDSGNITAECDAFGFEVDA